MTVSIHGHPIDEDARCSRCNRLLTAILATTPPPECAKELTERAYIQINEMTLEDYRRGYLRSRGEKQEKPND